MISERCDYEKLVENATVVEKCHNATCLKCILYIYILTLRVCYMCEFFKPSIDLI